MAKTIDERIDKFLVGDTKKVNELTLAPSEAGIKPGEYNNLSTGLRRIQFRFEKANTPQKYVDAFEVTLQLVQKFPLKSKVIWQAVTDAYQVRFGSAAGSLPEADVETGQEY